MEFKVSALCKGCGACVRDCGFGVLAMKDGRPVVREGREEQCMNCQHCLAVCPEGAVTINGVEADVTENGAYTAKIANVGTVTLEDGKIYVTPAEG